MISFSEWNDATAIKDVFLCTSFIFGLICVNNSVSFIYLLNWALNNSFFFFLQLNVIEWGEDVCMSPFQWKDKNVRMTVKRKGFTWSYLITLSMGLFFRETILAEGGLITSLRTSKIFSLQTLLFLHLLISLSFSLCYIKYRFVKTSSLLSLSSFVDPTKRQELLERAMHKLCACLHAIFLLQPALAYTVCNPFSVSSTR